MAATTKNSRTGKRRYRRLPSSTCSAGSFALAAELLKEVCDGHADRLSPEWNDCGTPETDCEWCREAKLCISEQNDEMRDR